LGKPPANCTGGRNYFEREKMFTDATRLRSETVHADVCIIGAGAAGISMGLELMGSPVRVAMLAGGGLDLEDAPQDLYFGDSNAGLPYAPLDETRFRYFGGSTGLEGWGGWCKPFSQHELERRPWLDADGWPIGREELDPYYERAHPILGLGPFDYDLASWNDHLGDQAVVLPDFGSGRMFAEICQLGPPIRFGRHYRRPMEEAENIDVLLHANAVEIETDPEGSRVTGVRVKTKAGNEFRVEAPIFVLAAGGIENARLLLASNRVHRRGLGNGNDLVGRFFMDNPMIWEGEIHLNEPGQWTELFDPHGKMRKRDQDIRGTYNRTVLAAGLAVSDKVQAGGELLNYRAWIAPFYSGDQSAGMDSARRIYWELKHRSFPRNFWRHVGTIVKDLPDVWKALSQRVFKSRRRNRRYLLANVLEQDPNPESRVMLMDEVDELGVPRVALKWELGPLVRRTLRVAHEVIGEELEAAGIGRLVNPFTGADVGEWAVTPDTTWHHMGTTRMHNDPAKGVVDRDCRVHGISNLYVAGSSVFPTGGNDMPTLTLVALAIRMADQIKERLALGEGG
jgi:choline dehydrogenase-like flavoprotein